MLTFINKTVRKHLGLFFMAVFFSSSASAADSSLNSLERGLNELIYNLSRSVVTVEATRRVSVPSFGNTPRETLQRLVSSGIICDTAGHILTAAPMVVDHEKIMVNINNRLYPARIMGIDYYYDLALLQTQPGLGQPVAFADNFVCAGQMIITIGNSYGLQVSPSMGFCAGLREDGNVQTTVPVGSGGIGGGIFDLSGNFLGMVIGQVGQDNQLALAVPSCKILPVIEYLEKNGDRQAGFVGIATAEIEIYPEVEISGSNVLTGSQGRMLTSGTIITSVLPMSPAARAGLRVGDLVLSFKNRPVTSPSLLADEVRRCQPGQVVNMEIMRQNVIYSVQLQVSRKNISQFTARLAESPTSPDEGRTADSLTRILNSLKKEIFELEKRLNQLR
ncbi:MAG: S1C family serine protease [candidate division Zixibacteria bacterium]|nr:S1C family serine protease [candidate division Zixibacteria bacterium]MDD5426887.1 S1C family serine protease [candidate division Zixibacteria bacterium]